MLEWCLASGFQYGGPVRLVFDVAAAVRLPGSGQREGILGPSTS